MIPPTSRAGTKADPDGLDRRPLHGAVLHHVQERADGPKRLQRPERQGQQALHLPGELAGDGDGRDDEAQRHLARQARPHHHGDGGRVRQHEQQPRQRDRDPGRPVSAGDVPARGVPLLAVPAPQLARQSEQAGLAARSGRGGEREQMTRQPGPGRGPLDRLTAPLVRRLGGQDRRDGEERQRGEDGNDRRHQDGRADQGQRGPGQPQQPVEGRPDVAPRASDHRRPVGTARTLVDLQRRRRADDVDERALDVVLDLLLQPEAGEVAGDEGPLGEDDEDRHPGRQRPHPVGRVTARLLADQSEQEREADAGGRFENRHRRRDQRPPPVDARSGREDEAQGADHVGVSSKRFACRRNSSAYRPSAVIRSSCAPSSMIWP